MTTLGFYGKLASRGDFVSRALPQSFIGPWDSWLAAGLLASQNSLGADWQIVRLHAHSEASTERPSLPVVGAAP